MLINFSTQEAVVGATLGAGAPLSFVLSVSYAIYLVGPSALVGCVIVCLFFPIMVSQTRLAMYMILDNLFLGNCCKITEQL